MPNLVKQRHFRYYIVYETINKINGKRYIGCHATDNLDDGYIGSGNLLKEAIKKYGIKSFERSILHSVDSPEEMFKIEASLVTEEFVKRTDTYNLVPGGFGGFKVQDIENWKSKLKLSRIGKTPALGLRHTEETRMKLSEINKGKAAWNKGLPGTFTGMKHSDAAKRKNSDAHKGMFAGEKNPMFGKSAVKGRKWYHNNTETFYLFPDDPRTPDLIPGRLPRATNR